VPEISGFQGTGKRIDVTVSTQPDGQFGVTTAAARSG
jgi:hypothetical protein